MCWFDIGDFIFNDYLRSCFLIRVAQSQHIILIERKTKFIVMFVWLEPFIHSVRNDKIVLRDGVNQVPKQKL